MNECKNDLVNQSGKFDKYIMEFHETFMNLISETNNDNNCKLLLYNSIIIINYL